MADNPQQTLRELRDLVVSYAKQETVDPIKGLGRYIGYGVGGAALIGTGVVFVAIGLLRALQTETGEHFTDTISPTSDNYSWVPYAIVAAAAHRRGRPRVDGERQTKEEPGVVSKADKLAKNAGDRDPDKKITRDDIEAKLRELRGDVDETVEEVRVPAIAIAVGVVVVTVVLAYWFGRRKGRKSRTVLEIRRI